MSLTYEAISDAYKTAMDIDLGLDERERIKWRLIHRYADKVSGRLLR